MKTRIVLGQLAIYFALAACGSAVKMQVADMSDPTAPLDPVPSAHADEADAAPPPPVVPDKPKPDVATESCNGGYAIHSYPGRSVNDLAQVAVVLSWEASSGDGFNAMQAPAFLKDGYVRVACSPIQKITFTLPPP